MYLYPAIDMYEKKAVRLLKGDYEKMTVYGEDTLKVALSFKKAGAGRIHLVDLEGAREGRRINHEEVVRIKKETGLFVEVGGGIREEEDVLYYLEKGIDRVILGTSAVTNLPFLKRMLTLYGERIAVGIDIKDGMVAIKGWMEKSEKEAFSFIKELEEMGLATIIVTDISKDGALKGTNRELYSQLKEITSMEIIASGGVSSLEDVIELRRRNVDGAIIGRAYYEGCLDLEEALKEART